MRVFWLNHGLHIDPENQEEANALVALVGSVRLVTKSQAMDEQDVALKNLSGHPSTELIIANS